LGYRAPPQHVMKMSVRPGPRPKYPPEVEGVTLVQTKSCRAYDMEYERDNKYVRGGFYKRKYLTKQKVPFQVFYKEYYLKQLKNTLIIVF
jgi:hypothetical protein